MDYSLKRKKKELQLVMFSKISNESNRKPNEIWVDKGSEFYNRSMKSFLQNNDLEIRSTHDEGKCVIAERFIEPYVIKFINPWLQFQKMSMVIN